MSRLPPLDEPNVLYVAVKQSEVHGEWYTGFYPFVMSTWVRTETTEVARVRVRERTDEDPPSDYWAWEDTEEPGKLRMVQCSEVRFGMQFPYGYKASQDAGQGRRVNVVVEIEERFPPLP